MGVMNMGSMNMGDTNMESTSMEGEKPHLPDNPSDFKSSYTFASSALFLSLSSYSPPFSLRLWGFEEIYDQQRTNHVF